MTIKTKLMAYLKSRVTTCLENLEMSGNCTDVREMSGISLKVRELSGKKSCHGKLCDFYNFPF